MLSNQPSHVPAKKAPACPKGHGPLRRCSVMSTPGEGMRLFFCREESCPYTIAVEIPRCGMDGQYMRLKSLWDAREKQALFYWRCEEHKRSETFEVCECGGIGWLHMDNRPDPQEDPHNSNNLGFVCGMHIDRCSECGHLRFKDPIAAERAHRKECGCGWGLPNAKEAHTWVDYGGRDGQVFRALETAGFKPLVTDSSDGEDFRTIEVHIAESQASHFIAVLDRAYDEIEEETMRRLRSLSKKIVMPLLDAPVRGFSKNELSRRMTPAAIPDGAPVCWGKQWELGDEECGTCSWERGCSTEATNREGSMSKEVLSRAVPALIRIIDQPADAVSVFNKEQITRAGCKPILRENGAILTAPSGRPIVVLDKIVSEDDPAAVQLKFLKEGNLAELKRAALLLLSQLNAMRFTDQPVAEQHRLNSRCRGLIAALDGVEALSTGKDPQSLHRSTSWARDRLTQLQNDNLSLVGGYRLEGLERENRVLQGRVYLDGQHFRMVAVEVHDINGVQEAIDDPNDWYHTILELNDSNMATQKLPPYPGEYVVCIYPSGR